MECAVGGAESPAKSFAHRQAARAMMRDTFRGDSLTFGARALWPTGAQVTLSLQTVLQTKEGQAAMTDQLAKEYSEENIEFWKAVRPSVPACACSWRLSRRAPREGNGRRAAGVAGVAQCATARWVRGTRSGGGHRAPLHTGRGDGLLEREARQRCVCVCVGQQARAYVEAAAEARPELAKTIADRYIKESGEMQVNIPDGMRVETLKVSKGTLRGEGGGGGGKAWAGEHGDVNEQGS